MNYINLFVPGRVSVIGELSDIMVEHIKINNKIIPGEVIASGIEKGIYATATLSDDFIFEFNEEKFQVKNMDLKTLDETATSNNFFSYVASVARLIKNRYHTSGINIKVRYMTLPIQKGLSSSASVCVLVTKAFNELYKLNLKYNDIMEIAYEAERYALSMCGRLDQICAKGLEVSHIIFHEDRLDINKINIKKELNFVIADLNGFKDTKKILSTLCSCFPFPKNELEEAVRKTLCEDNKYLVHEAIKAIATGNKKYLGKILVEAQLNLDNSGGKLTDSLEGPILHKMMNDDFIKENSYGSKGTGSNGDGSIVVLAKNKTTQKKIIKYLSEQHGMNAFEFNLKPTPEVTTAFVNTLKNNLDTKQLLSILDILDSQNITNIIVAGSKKNIDKYKEILNPNHTDEYFEKLSIKEKEYQIKLCRIYEKISFINKNKIENKTISKYTKEPIIYISTNDKKIKEVLKQNNKIIISENFDINKIEENIIIK